MAIAPTFAATPKLYVGQVTAANALRDGTGTLVALCTAAASGEKVNEIAVEATVTTTAGMVRLFISKDGGTTKRMFDEITVSAVTVSASVAAYRASKVYTNLILEASDILYASTEKAEAINVYVMAGRF